MELKYNSAKEVLISLLAGFFIGVSIIVPGLSGSSLAIVLKIYDKIMYAFSNIFKKFKMCFLFLLPVIGGIVVGFVLGFILVEKLIGAFPFVTICFFVGLMLGATPLLFREIKAEKITPKRAGLFTVGVIIPIVIAVVALFLQEGTDTLSTVEPYHYVLFLVIGVLISVTQLIPGLSATVLLMIFGYYSVLLTKIKNDLFSEWKFLLLCVTMVVGFLIGTLLFSKLINKLLEIRRVPFYFTICGLSVSSVVAVFLGDECVSVYKSWQTASPMLDIVLGIALMGVGFIVTFGFFLLERKKEKNI